MPYNSGYYYGGVDIWYLVLVLPAFLITLYAQFKVKSTFNKFSQYSTRSGITGYDAARRVLDSAGLQYVAISRTSGTLSDYYDPTQNTIFLSDSTYGKATIAAAGVAAHEAGHACQHAEEYAPLKLRTAIIPICNFGAGLAWPVILIGYMLGFGGLVYLGIALFSLSTFFQLVTLPVEFNASRRALASLEGCGLLNDDELYGAKKVLSAAALTYVASLAMSVANLLRLILIFSDRGSNRRRR